MEDPGAGGAPMGRTLCITEVVLQESIAHYSRRMDEAVVRLERWRSKHAGGLSVQPLVAEFAQQALGACSIVCGAAQVCVGCNSG